MSKLQKIKPKRSHVVTVIGVAVVLFLASYGLVHYEHQKQVEAHQVALQREADIQAAKEQKAREEAVQAQLTHVTSQRDQLCDLLSTLSTAKATRSYVTVPVANCAK